MFATSRKWLVWPSSCSEVSRCAPLRPHTARAHALTCTRNARPSEYHGVTPIFSAHNHGSLSFRRSTHNVPFSRSHTAEAQFEPCLVLRPASFVPKALAGISMSRCAMRWETRRDGVSSAYLRTQSRSPSRTCEATVCRLSPDLRRGDRTTERKGGLRWDESIAAIFTCKAGNTILHAILSYMKYT